MSKLEETSHKLPALQTLPEQNRETYRQAWLKEMEQANNRIFSITADTAEVVASALAPQHAGDPAFVGEFLQTMNQNIYSMLQTFMLLQSMMPDEVLERFHSDFVKSLNISTEAVMALKEAYNAAATSSPGKLQ